MAIKGLATLVVWLFISSAMALALIAFANVIATLVSLPAPRDGLVASEHEQPESQPESRH